MKEKNWILSIAIWIFIVAIGLFRTDIIHHNELVAGKPTMTGSFTFLAYLIVATIVFFISLIIFKVNSVKEIIFSKPIKIIINISILIITLPIVFFILLFFH